MKRIHAVAAALVLCLVPAAAVAQGQETLKFQGETEAYHGLGIATYQLQVVSLPGGPVIDVYCIDPLVYAHSNEYTSWTSPVTTSTLQHTKVYGYTGGDATATFETYWKTAWLATQFEQLLAGTSTYTNSLEQRAAIQGALWEVGGMLPRTNAYGATVASGADVWSVYGAGTPPTGISDWVTRAADAWAADPNQIDASEWVVLTTQSTTTGQQEFLTHAMGDHTDSGVVPEPATLLLMGTGLLGIFGVGFKRRRTA